MKTCIWSFRSADVFVVFSKCLYMIQHSTNPYKPFSVVDNLIKRNEFVFVVLQKIFLILLE